MEHLAAQKMHRTPRNDHQNLWTDKWICRRRVNRFRAAKFNRQTTKAAITESIKAVANRMSKLARPNQFLPTLAIPNNIFGVNILLRSWFRRVEIYLPHFCVIRHRPINLVCNYFSHSFTRWPNSDQQDFSSPVFAGSKFIESPSAKSLPLPPSQWLDARVKLPKQEAGEVNSYLKMTSYCTV
jgi:hypothetical protein